MQKRFVRKSQEKKPTIEMHFQLHKNTSFLKSFTDMIRLHFTHSLWF